MIECLLNVVDGVIIVNGVGGAVVSIHVPSFGVGQ